MIPIIQIREMTVGCVYRGHAWVGPLRLRALPEEGWEVGHVTSRGEENVPTGPACWSAVCMYLMCVFWLVLFGFVCSPDEDKPFVCVRV